MTTRRRQVGTASVSKGQAKKRTLSPNPLATSDGTNSESTGMLCFYCHEMLIADQPGGLNGRHLVTGVKYGQCNEAIKQKEN